ncbi:cytochrome c-type biogenesis protein CcmH [Pseudoduganella sp. SL102]|uniref:cytochrome c-type biogenesis protein n=1 Tax=Pseudoduganella sp. SL102 TaxID=2995154 RepID=UPI00248BE164|nr:cytochrome c-type biogenesis protein [Pseudoduganella sp. SL102]WBS00978.1 cytochrome c-type biogenesis protein CcmH [Pseudoduganella sp. SL102]
MVPRSLPPTPHAAPYAIRYVFRLAFLFALLRCMACASAAAAPDNDTLERRTQSVAQELRCLVCQNQTIADSQADLAVDLRRQVREQLRDGRSEEEVVRYMTDRYGDFVVYRPPVKASTALLWFGPVLLLLAGAIVLVLRIRRMPRDAVLSAAERERAERLLDGQLNREGDSR